MRLLLVTQVVDTEDLYLSFFTQWINELALHFDSIEVICLKRGSYNPPSNVRIHSLGKERGAHFFSRIFYIVYFMLLIWRLRSRYDTVLVHMNQEYVLLAGWLWRLLGKPVSMWRNHYAGSWLTTVAAFFCTKLFCTSEHSYTARYRKTVLMPVGVDTKRFSIDDSTRTPKSILFFARMAPSKNPFLLLEALRKLTEKNISFTATFAGSALPEYEAYYQSLVSRTEHYKLSERVLFVPGVPNSEAPALFHSHDIFVNCARSGMFDKAIFEAASSGCHVLASSDDLKHQAGEAYWFDGSVDGLAARLDGLLTSDETTDTLRDQLLSAVEKNSLSSLGAALAAELHSNYRPTFIKQWLWHLLFILAHAVPRTPRMSVLLYHSISNDISNRFAVSPTSFERQLRYLRKRFDVVPLSRAYEYAAGLQVKRDSVAITFDDGYSDFATAALPLLRRYNFPSTVFLLGGEPDRRELGNDLPLIERIHTDALEDSLVEIGSHAATHRKLTKISEEEARTELCESRRVIAADFGVTPRYLAYPKGSYNARVMQLAREAGYEGAVSVVERAVRVGDDPYCLPRIQIDKGTTPSIFAAKVTAATDWYYALWRFMKR